MASCIINVKLLKRAPLQVLSSFKSFHGQRASTTTAVRPQTTTKPGPVSTDTSGTFSGYTVVAERSLKFVFQVSIIAPRFRKKKNITVNRDTS